LKETLSVKSSLKQFESIIELIYSMFYLKRRRLDGESMNSKITNLDSSGSGSKIIDEISSDFY